MRTAAGSVTVGVGALSFADVGALFFERGGMADNLLIETRERVGLVRINRPQRMNALNNDVAREINDAFRAFDANPDIGCMVITGNEKAFAAGADIGAMAEWNYAKVYGDDYITADWEGIRSESRAVIRIRPDRRR